MAELRKIMLSKRIEQEMIGEAIEKIIEWNHKDDQEEEKLKKYERPVIKIFVNTYGGSTYDANGLCSIIENSKTPIHTIVLGKAMSAGFWITMFGHKRFAYKHSTLLYHQLRGGVDGDKTRMEDYIDVSKELQIRLDDMVLDKTNIKKNQLDEYNRMRKDWYMTPQQALKLGVIDEIIE